MESDTVKNASKNQKKTKFKTISLALTKEREMIIKFLKAVFKVLEDRRIPTTSVIDDALKHYLKYILKNFKDIINENKSEIVEELQKLGMEKKEAENYIKIVLTRYEN